MPLQNSKDILSKVMSQGYGITQQHNDQGTPLQLEITKCNTLIWEIIIQNIIRKGKSGSGLAVKKSFLVYFERNSRWEFLP